MRAPTDATPAPFRHSARAGDRCSATACYRRWVRFKPGQLVSNKYRIERLLGVGGMGEVYVAVNDVLQKQVALKVMTSKAESVTVERFFREGIAASRVRHRSIVQVFDAGIHDGAPWLAMEFLEGESLRARLT